MHKLKPKQISQIEEALDRDRNLLIKPGADGIPKIYIETIHRIL